MKAWRDDPRFQCPHCQRVIFLSELEPNKHPMTACGVVAICIPCRRLYFAEEWRKHYRVRDPSVDADL
jgi:hypothetical protein